MTRTLLGIAVSLCSLSQVVYTDADKDTLTIAKQSGALLTVSLPSSDAPETVTVLGTAGAVSASHVSTKKVVTPSLEPEGPGDVDIALQATYRLARRLDAIAVLRGTHHITDVHRAGAGPEPSDFLRTLSGAPRQKALLGEGHQAFRWKWDASQSAIVESRTTTYGTVNTNGGPGAWHVTDLGADDCVSQRVDSLTDLACSSGGALFDGTTLLLEGDDAEDAPGPVSILATFTMDGAHAYLVHFLNDDEVTAILRKDSAGAWRLQRVGVHPYSD